ncbi:MAG: hypothetical protein ACP5I7_03435 [Sulfolobales archaeon]
MLNIASIVIPEGIVISILNVTTVESRVPKKRIAPIIDEYGIFLHILARKLYGKSNINS